MRPAPLQYASVNSILAVAAEQQQQCAHLFDQDAKLKFPIPGRIQFLAIHLLLGGLGLPRRATRLVPGCSNQPLDLTGDVTHSQVKTKPAGAM
jgi:hypothetical protein